MKKKIIDICNPVPTGTELGISHLLIEWYHKSKRDLPWRHSSDPYIIWISEIILQQTRVAQGLDYFRRFIERFPDVKSLAAASEEEVLKQWQGLGYYSRARNLHAAAQTIVEQFGGSFPQRYNEVRSLRGIGDYTAAAIVSFAWNLPYPVVDGNVFRVLSRLYAEATPIDTTAGKRLFTHLATMLLDPQNAGLHNQALMELGALQCVPGRPDCSSCPLSMFCLANRKGNPEAYPVKQNRTKVRDRYFHYLFITYKEYTWLHRRTGKDIWVGLYEFPLIETDKPADFADVQQTDTFRELLGNAGRLEIDTLFTERCHQLSHQTLHVACYWIHPEREPAALSGLQRVRCTEIGRYPVPALIAELLQSTIFR